MAHRGVATALSCCAALAGCMPPAGVRYPGLPRQEDGALHVINFDVGQADALLIMYRGKTLLADCGSPLSEPLKTSRVLPRRLDALIGGRHIDYFLITHYHQDHVGAPGGRQNQSQPSGIYALIERDGLTIGTILDRGTWTLGAKGGTQRHYEEHVQQWIDRGIVGSRRVVVPGESIDLGPGLEVTVVSAAGNGVLDRMDRLYPTFVAEAPPSENDYSVGIKVTLGDFELFSAGDLTGANVVRSFGPKKQSYNDIETHIATQVGAVEVYRVNHHGSHNSSNPCFAEVLHPQVSVFSTGTNGYGHPDLEVYRRLKRHGDVFITGGAAPAVRGAVAPDIVGEDVEVLVAPDGKMFFVNGRPYRSLGDADEDTRRGALSQCPEHVLLAAPDSYTILQGAQPTD